ncbi:MAG TPA: citrate lyase holo-[acyl-carrier protein] synthase, partial [Erysipelothrix sp.]|nr:citrate lyase holo-[acyl-carrier protein] synthase [Erysipelothrix sp.]
MNIVPLTSESIEKLRLERSRFVKDMIQNQKGVLLVLGGAFAGENRQHHALSYAITSIFFELYERYTIDFWTYTFDAEGLIYYIRIDEDPKAIKNTMIHYEDYHPLGFAISSDVYTSEKRWTREMLKASSRQDFYYKKPVDELLN